MIYRKILIAGLLLQMTSLYGIQLGSNLLKNSPTQYLIDIAKVLKDAEATLQIGQELSLRDAMTSLQVYEQVTGGVHDEPEEDSYPYVLGVWVWIADTPTSETGAWYWIPKNMPYYIAVLMGHNVA